MADYAPTVRKILSENDCHFERQGKGDHEICYIPETFEKLPILSFRPQGEISKGS
jgi:hypothetical protein